MKKIIHIAKANIFGHKSATVSLFIIVMIASMLMTISLSVLLGVNRNFEESIDERNSTHSVFVMTKEMYDPAFEEIIKNDNRVSQCESSEVLSPSSVKVQYGGEADIQVMILNLENSVSISPPTITEQDLSAAQDRAIYLPSSAKNFNYSIGDTFTLIYKNKPIQLTVAGFFETNEFASVNMGMMLKFFVPNMCYEMLKQEFSSSIIISIRFFDIADSQQFNRDFASEIDIDLADYAFAFDASLLEAAAITPVMVVTAVLMVFALIILSISMLVIRFRIIHSIEDTMHEIGVLKSAGYTSAQIIACYVMEYGAASFCAALVGVGVSLPLFPLMCTVMTSMSGFLWSLKANIPAGLIAAIAVVAILLIMVLRACRAIKKLPPVTALRGGIATNSFRRNYFPLRKGAGSVHTRLGFKNIFVFFKTYVMTGIIIAVMSFATICVAVLYQNFVLDMTTFSKMLGFESSDVQISVTRHTDADALAAQLEQRPEVRKTSMMDWVWFQSDGSEVMGYISNDFGQMEDIFAHDGRFPAYDNEVAIPKIFADRLGKQIGDTIVVTVSGVSQEYIITGYFSASSNSGRIVAITLEGYQKLDPNYQRNTINVYLNEGISFDDFSKTLQQDYGVLNIYEQDETGSFPNAKAKAEEKISNYMEQYDIDSAEYAVIYNGEIILSGSSDQYQIEKITDTREFLKSSLGTFGSSAATLVQVVTLLSLIIISIIISMTIRSIVTKRYRELGTLKALGFTTKQLARQLAISFLPCAAIGIIIGCTGGAALASPMLSSLFASTGTYGNIFAVSPLIVCMVGMLFLIAAFTIANLAANRIKNISAYELISDTPIVKKKRKKFRIKKVIAVLIACLTLLPLATSAYALELAPTSTADIVPDVSQQLYGIGSVSKVFTAAAVMKLVDDGQIHLDTPLTVYMSDFRMADERYTSITPRMLLNHSAGFMGMTDNNAFLLGDNDMSFHDNFLDLLASQTLKHNPGERSIYCNDASTLAEILVERVSGVSFTEFLETNFFIPLGLEYIETPQSDFDRSLLATTYWGNNALKPENLGVIGSGGIYSTVEDLCRFATIFMESSDGSILSKQSTDEMAKNQHKNEMVPTDSPTTLRYGLGWDCVECYPFSQYGIKALGKGGGTIGYHTFLTVLPEYNLAAAVVSSGSEQQEQLIVQEILLAVLEEEGLIPDSTITMPTQNLQRAKVPESLKSYAGIYTLGTRGQWNIEFTEYSLIITPILVRNERPVEYYYNTDGVFVSTDNGYMGINAAIEGVNGVGVLSFAEGKYIVMQTYERLPGLSTTAMTMPFAEKLESNMVSAAAMDSWKVRNDKEYLLVSEKYSSMRYIGQPLAKTLADDRVYGYVAAGIYRGGGTNFNMAKITDETTALGFQSIPTMTGRDTNNLYITNIDGVEYLGINHYRYIDAADAKILSEIGGMVVIDAETAWVDIGIENGGRMFSITTPQNGAWFVYDDKMNCVATSLEAMPRDTIILPENGRLAFAGDEGTVFEIK
jgi:Beta-lactamase class C and other penicillin binding proteins